MKRNILMGFIVVAAVFLPYTLKAQIVIENADIDSTSVQSNAIGDFRCPDGITGCLVNHNVVLDSFQTFREPTLRFAEDTWTSHDKLDHLAGGMVTTSLTSLLWQPHTNGDVWQRAGINVAAWFLYEIKDGLIDWKPTRKWGGDGFSYKDGVWSAVGVLLITSVILTAR